MPPIKIISATERMQEQRGAKILLLGPPGVGKTWQLRKLDPEKTLFIDIEAGDLSVLDWPVPTIRLYDWPMARDLAVKVVGAEPELPADGVLFGSALRWRRSCTRKSRTVRDDLHR